FERAERLRRLPPYLFAEIDRRKRELIKQGKDLVNLGVGDPDLPAFKVVRDALKAALDEPGVHSYPPDNGLPEFREAVSRWYQRRAGAKVDPEREIRPVIGSKEGIGHLPLAVLNPGDVALIPDPGYPPYRSGTEFAGGVPYFLPLRRENGFLPDLDAIDPQVLKRARILYVNYPNNPTGAVAPESFYRKVIDFARKHNLLVVHDAAYSEMWYDQKPPLFLQFDGAKEVGVEFHSLTKTYNMAGWRVGWVAGNPEVVSALGDLKTNLDSGVFSAIQKAAVAALEKADEDQVALRKVYQRRRDLFVEGMRKAGWPVEPMKATFYVWTPVPKGTGSIEFCRRLLEEGHVVTTPGVGFGPSGEGFFRVSLTSDEARIQEAVSRLAKLAY
ncbi:MAG: LL-diaminopimelate aminotransferase, partial [Planctomycetota bacterium]